MPFTRTAISTTGNTTAGSPNLTSVANTAGIYAGMLIYGNNIPADTIVNSVSGTTVVMSRNAAGTQTGVALTGQYITQTGTDTDPSGLAAMAGVTTITSGTGSRLKSIFDLGPNQLRIQGSLTHDPDQYTFVSGLQMAVRVESGAYNYGLATTVNGKTSYSKGCGLELTYQGGIASNFPIQITGGTFAWRGGIIRLGGAFSIAGGTFDQKGDTSVAYNNNTGTQIQLRTILGSAHMRYDKIKLAGVNQVFFWTTQSYNTISAALENGGIQTPAGFSATQTYADFEFASNQAPGDFYINQLSSASSTLSIVKNPDVIPRVIQLNTGAYGVVETRESLTFAVSDANGLSAGNVVGYVKDSNNGARTNENQLTHYTSDQVYVAASNAAGDLNLGDVLVNVQMRNPAATTTVKHDYRGNFGATSVDFSVYLGGYEFQPTVTRQTLLGNGGRSVAWTMFDDANITLTRADALALVGSKVAIDAATKTVTVLQSATLSDVYDAIKAHKYTGGQANMETPAVDALVFSASGNRLTGYADWGLVVNAGATLSASAKFKEFALSGTGRVTNNGSITVPFRDADGLRVTVTGLDPEGFGITWYLRHSPAGAGTWTNVSGAGNSALILLTDGAYDVQVRAPGYDWSTDLAINTAESLTLNAGLRYQVSAANTPQYSMPFDATLEAAFAYNPASGSVSVTNTTGAITQPGFAELYRATQRIQHIPALVWTWTAPVTANATSQKILIPAGNPITLYLTDDSTNTVKITCPVIHADSGQSADDRVRGNVSGYSIILGSPATAESAGLAAQIIGSLGGPDFDSTDHGLSTLKSDQDLTKSVIDLIKTAVDAIKPRTDLIPDAPAAVGDAMALTADYDAAKAAASQSSVDTLSDAVGALAATTGTPLQAGDYTAPDNAGIAATLAAVQAIEPAEPPDLSGIPAAVRAELAPELARIDVAVSTRSTLTAQDIPEGLTADQVWTAENRTLTETAGLTPAQAAQLDALTTDVGALSQAVDAVGEAVGDVPTAVRTELTPELARIDVSISTRSTLTAQDIPAGLTAEQVWAAENRTLTDAPGLPTAQADQLRKVAQLHGVGAQLQVTETSRTAGDVSQTITTAEDGTTTVSAA